MTTAERIEKARNKLADAYEHVKELVAEAEQQATAHKQDGDSEVVMAAAQKAGARYRLGLIIAGGILNTRNLLHEMPGVDWQEKSKPRESKKRKAKRSQRHRR